MWRGGAKQIPPTPPRMTLALGGPAPLCLPQSVMLALEEAPRPRPPRARLSASSGRTLEYGHLIQCTSTSMWHACAGLCSFRSEMPAPHLRAMHTPTHVPVMVPPDCAIVRWRV